MSWSAGFFLSKNLDAGSNRLNLYRILDVEALDSHDQLTPDFEPEPDAGLLASLCERTCIGPITVVLQPNPIEPPMYDYRYVIYLHYHYA